MRLRGVDGRLAGRFDRCIEPQGLSGGGVPCSCRRAGMCPAGGRRWTACLWRDSRRMLGSGRLQGSACALILAAAVKLTPSPLLCPSFCRHCRDLGRSPATATPLALAPQAQRASLPLCACLHTHQRRLLPLFLSGPLRTVYVRGGLKEWQRSAAAAAACAVARAALPAQQPARAPVAPSSQVSRFGTRAEGC